MNSVQSLKNHFLEQLEATPSKDEIVNYVEEIKRKVDKATAAEGAEEPPPPTETKPPQQPPGPPGPGHRGPGEVSIAKSVPRHPVFLRLVIVGRTGSSRGQTAHSVVCHRNEIADGGDSLPS